MDSDLRSVLELLTIMMVPISGVLAVAWVFTVWLTGRYRLKIAETGADQQKRLDAMREEHHELRRRLEVLETIATTSPTLDWDRRFSSAQRQAPAPDHLGAARAAPASSEGMALPPSPFDEDRAAEAPIHAHQAQARGR
jgi:hypothetical protein